MIFTKFSSNNLNLFLKKKSHTSRGIIGIEAAIVLIAFVIVAAALTFVVLNVGFETTQKAKTSIKSGLDVAGSTPSISGKVVGQAQSGASPLTAVMIPLKLTSGGQAVDLNTTSAKVSYLSESVEYDNIYLNGCTLNGVTYATPDLAWAAAETVCQGVAAGQSPFPPSSGQPCSTDAIIYWAVDDGNFNTILSEGEHAVLSIAWAALDEPISLEKIKAELTLSGGATLTVERTVPNISDTIVDLG